MRSLFRHKKRSVSDNAPKVLHIEHLPVPVHIYVEHRQNSRISLLKEKINIRLPLMMSSTHRDVEITKLISWAQRRISKKGIYDRKQLLNDYLAEPEVKINGRVWTLKFTEDPRRKNFNGNLDESTEFIEIKGPFSKLTSDESNELIKKLLLKILTNKYKEFIINQVSTINDSTFKFNYNSVKLKYMTSRWGSCSSKLNINLSLRLLLLPDEVRDYVIIHELAHLAEMNHSPKFWGLVAEHVPNYKQIEKWLKLNGNKYDF